MSDELQSLLQPGDPDAVESVNAGGPAPFLLIGDHAGNMIPGRLGTLGVAEADRQRHIGWDIGVDALGRRLSERLDAAFIRQRFSRLVIDCNRDPASPEAVPEASDGTAIPGNIGLSAAARAQRVDEIHAPYQAAIATALAARPGSDVLVSLHSFTPSLAGAARPWHLGVLHNRGNDALARAVLAWLVAHSDRPIGDNEPYRMDATDYTVPRHAFPPGRPYLELEVRQDLLEGASGVESIADLVAAALLASILGKLASP